MFGCRFIVVLNCFSFGPVSSFSSQPHPILPDALADFCHRRGVYWHVVPEDVDLIPPKHAVKQIGQHNTDRSLREQLNYLYYGFAAEAEDDLDGEVDAGILLMEQSSSGVFE